MKCPCIDCLLIPVCRHKRFFTVFCECDLLKDYDPQFQFVNKRSFDKLTEVSTVLKSTKWSVLGQEEGDYLNVYIDQPKNSGFIQGNEYREIKLPSSIKDTM